jgi:hypothetical protein
VVVARVYQGIHFRFADEDAQKPGRLLAKWAFTRYLRPVGHGHENDGDDGEEDRD